MHNWNRREVTAAALALLAPTLSLRANAQAGPRGGAAKVFCGFPPGDSADLVARIYIDKMLPAFPQGLIVDNRAGAGGRTALDMLRREPADGNSFILTPSSMLTLAPHAVKGVPYDALKDFAPISRACINPFALSVGPMVPASIQTLEQFLAWCKENPTLANYGTAGVGTTMHLLGANFARLAKVSLNMVPYRGGGPAATDLVGGQVASVMSTLPGVMEFARAGKIRILAVSSETRWHGLPDVPTFAESGYPDLTFVQWFGFVAPAGTPKAALERINAQVRQASRMPDVIKALENMGLAAATSATPAEFAKDVRTEHERWRGIVQAIGFKAEG